MKKLTELTKESFLAGSRFKSSDGLSEDITMWYQDNKVFVEIEGKTPCAYDILEINDIGYFRDKTQRLVTKYSWFSVIAG